VTVDDYILLSYARRRELENDEHLMDGFITTREGKNGLSTPFEGLTYRKMMSRVSEMLQSYPNYPVHVHRTDAAISMAHQLSDADRVLLRDDPTAYIKQTTIPPVLVIVRDKPAPAARLRAGHDALSDAFGEELYLRVKGLGLIPVIESPISGRWVGIDSIRDDVVVFTDTKAQLHGLWQPRISMPLQERKWMSITVDALLQTEHNLFFLPREWNKRGPWINRDDLTRMLEEFRQAKATAEKEIES